MVLFPTDWIPITQKKHLTHCILTDETPRTILFSSSSIFTKSLNRMYRRMIADVKCLNRNIWFLFPLLHRISIYPSVYLSPKYQVPFFFRVQAFLRNLSMEIMLEWLLTSNVKMEILSSFFAHVKYVLHRISIYSSVYLSSKYCVPFFSRVQAFLPNLSMEII